MTTRMMLWMLAGAVISLNADNAVAQARSNQPPATPPVSDPSVASFEEHLRTHRQDAVKVVGGWWSRWPGNPRRPPTRSQSLSSTSDRQSTIARMLKNP